MPKGKTKPKQETQTAQENKNIYYDDKHDNNATIHALITRQAAEGKWSKSHKWKKEQNDKRIKQSLMDERKQICLLENFQTRSNGN